MSARRIRRIPPSEDLHRIFRDPVDAQQEEESFADLLEQHLTDDLLHPKDEQTRQPPSLRHYPAPQDECDLHGCTARQAEARAEAFVQDARLRRLLTVRLIVGKGLHSSGPAVLPEVIERLLSDLKQHNRIAAYRWEKRSRSRSGALVIYLPRP